MDKKRLRILILDGGRQALPFLRSLRRAGHHVSVACGSRLTPGYFSRYASRRLVWPDYFKDPDGFTARMLDYLRRHPTDVTLAVGDASAGILARNHEQVSRLTHITVPPLDTFNQAADKANTMRFCMQENIPCPQTYTTDEMDIEAIIEKTGFPVMVKPRCGIGAIGLHRFDEMAPLKEHLQAIEKRHGALLVQEFIPLEGGTQYQAEAFLDADSKMKACMVILKPRFFPVTGGTSTANQTIDRPDIQECVRQLLEGLGWTGAADVDLILDPRDNTPKVLEINPRVTAGIKIGFRAGIDYAHLHLCLAMGWPVPEALDYRFGVYSRNLIMDILWYLFSGRQAKRETPLPFFRFFGPDVCYQTFSQDDFMPLAGFFLGMLKKYSNPKIWAAKLGRDLDKK